ncbi:MAG: hypothetical protein ACKOE6_14185, partial [Flammeovirgaceae bacterium]
KDGSRTIHDSKGVAALSPGFINAAEIYEDEVSGESYPAYGYETGSANCSVSFVVSTSIEDGNVLKARIKYIACIDDKALKMIEEMPTLRASVK